MKSLNLGGRKMTMSYVSSFSYCIRSGGVHVDDDTRLIAAAVGCANQNIFRATFVGNRSSVSRQIVCLRHHERIAVHFSRLRRNKAGPIAGRFMAAVGSFTGAPGEGRAL